MVAYADQRQRISMLLIVGLPLVALIAAGFPRPMARVVIASSALLVVLLSLWDVATLVSALLARRRMIRGLAPVRAGIDYGIGPDVWIVTAPADDPYRAQDRRELVARGSPEAAARVLAGNLLRRTCGVAALGLAVLGVGYCLMTPVCHCSDRSAARSAAHTIRSATILYVNEHPGQCPSFEDLKADGALERSFSSRDPWGNGWQIRCAADEVTVSTAGPDRKPGTEDDCMVPPPPDGR